MKKFVLPVCCIVLGVLVLFCGCEAKNPPDTSTEPPGQAEVSAPAQSTGTQKTSAPSTSEPSFTPTFAFTDNAPPAVGTPEKIEAVAGFREQMGKKPYTLSPSEKKNLLSYLKRLKLRGYDDKKSNVMPVDGGGSLITLYYADGKTVRYNFTSKDNIAVQLSGQKDWMYFMDSSEAYEPLTELLITYCAK